MWNMGHKRYMFLLIFLNFTGGEEETQKGKKNK